MYEFLELFKKINYCSMLTCALTILAYAYTFTRNFNSLKNNQDKIIFCVAALILFIPIWLFIDYVVYISIKHYLCPWLIALDGRKFEAIWSNIRFFFSLFLSTWNIAYLFICLGLIIEIILNPAIALFVQILVFVLPIKIFKILKSKIRRKK